MLANARKFLPYVSRYAAEHNWRLTLVNDGLCPLGWRGDGALVSFSRSKPQMEYVRRLIDGGVPSVGMSFTEPSIKIPRVLADFAHSGRTAAKYLWSMGYRNFVFCTSERLSSADIAYNAFSKELRGRGHKGDVPWVVRNEVIPKSRRFDAERIAEALNKHVLSLPKPLGIWCMSDAAAAEAVEAAVQCQMSIPDSVGILGTNDDALRCENAEVPISSIHSDFRGMALRACAMLDRIMAGERVPAESEFVKGLGITERDSTGVYTGDEVIRSALEWMKDNLSTAAGVQQLAEEIGVSESTLCRMFREKLHSTPAAELRSLRLKRAKSLLRTTDFPLGYIANASGFANAPHLVNIFRESEGETPAVWRRRWE